MPNQTSTVLAPYIERARKVLQFEQRANHQDNIVKPGGLELFVVRWADETSAICKKAGLDLKPIYRFTEYLEGYRRQDPMQRASSLRTALSVLNELENSGAGNNTGIQPQTGNPGKVSPDITKPSSFRDDLVEIPPSGRPQGSPLQKSDSREREPIRLEAGMSSGHASLALLSAEITAVPGVGPSIAAKLRSLGIRTIRDLLFYFPRQHRDYSKLEKIANIPPG